MTQLLHTLKTITLCALISTGAVSAQSYIPISGPMSATASSIESSYQAADYAVDGDMQSRWSSHHSNYHWLKIDLGSVQDIKKLELHWEAAYAQSYKIYVSETESNWGTLVHEQYNGNGGFDKIAKTMGTGRYITIECLNRGTVYGFSLYEVNAFTTRGVKTIWLGELDAYPTNPTAGEAFFHTGENKSFAYSDDAWQLFAIGETGATGPQGETGDTGIQGIQGEIGPQGVQGTTGDKGDAGANGAQGEKGDTGSQGIQGATGDKGDAGANGAQGIQGATGDKGDAGANGTDGATGLNSLISTGYLSGTADTDDFSDIATGNNWGECTSFGKTKVRGNATFTSSYALFQCRENNNFPTNYIGFGDLTRADGTITFAEPVTYIKFSISQMAGQHPDRVIAINGLSEPLSITTGDLQTVTIYNSEPVSSITFSTEETGTTHLGIDNLEFATCLGGGLTVSHGVDSDANGTLDQSEVSDTKYLCGNQGTTTVE